MENFRITFGMTFGQTLAKLRKEAGYSLREAAAKIVKEGGKPISFQYLSELENDRRKPPSDHLIEQIASALNVSPAIFYIKARRFPPYYGTDNHQQAAAAFQAMSEKLETAA